MSPPVTAAAPAAVSSNPAKASLDALKAGDAAKKQDNVAPGNTDEPPKLSRR
jgi:hypothetical protein